MNNSVVTDTMAVVLRLEKRRLPQRVRSLFKDAEKGNRKLYIPAMVLAEIGYLSERGRIDVSLTPRPDYRRNSVKKKTDAHHQRSSHIPLSVCNGNMVGSYFPCIRSFTTR